jgi:DNA replication initiation complex subunit (GINS family)
MYDELYEIWKRELENNELEILPPDFYSKIADYLRRLKEESRMLDKRSVKSNLLKKEMQNVKFMIRDLIWRRYKKSIEKTVKDEKVQANVLTAEEEKIYSGFSSSTEMCQNFAKNILRGHVPEAHAEQVLKRDVLRFLKDVPAIIGTDMKTCGPFKVEDVASLPIENAKILVKQGLAEKVELIEL